MLVIVIAHIAGVPVEELLVPWASGTAAGAGVLLLARIWVMSRVRH